MNDRELDPERVGLTHPTPPETLHQARLACADAVIRGVFPRDELADCLAMLGLLPKKRGTT